MNTETIKALIKDSKQTKRLDLSNLDLDEVPQEVVKLHHLAVLDLSFNNLYSLPEELFENNKDLVEVNVSNNKLETLPVSLGELVNVRVNASRNMLKTIPSNYYKLYGEGEATYYPRAPGGGWWSTSSNEARINLQDNPDLDINPHLARDQPEVVKTALKEREIREKQNLEEQQALETTEKQKQKQLLQEEKKEIKRDRKNSAKDRTKNMRQEREDF